MLTPLERATAILLLLILFFILSIFLMIADFPSAAFLALLIALVTGSLILQGKFLKMSRLVFWMVFIATVSWTSYQVADLLIYSINN